LARNSPTVVANVATDPLRTAPSSARLAELARGSAPPAVHAQDLTGDVAGLLGHQDGDRAQLLPDRGERAVHLGRIRHVGGVGELRVGRLQVDRRDLVAVGVQPLRDCPADARAAPADDGRLHDRAHKNLPSIFENHTLKSGRHGSLGGGRVGVD